MDNLGRKSFNCRIGTKDYWLPRPKGDPNENPKVPLTEESSATAQKNLLESWPGKQVKNGSYSILRILGKQTSKNKYDSFSEPLTSKQVLGELRK